MPGRHRTTRAAKKQREPGQLRISIYFSRNSRRSIGLRSIRQPIRALLALEPANDPQTARHLTPDNGPVEHQKTKAVGIAGTASPANANTAKPKDPIPAATIAVALGPFGIEPKSDRASALFLLNLNDFCPTPNRGVLIQECPMAPENASMNKAPNSWSWSTVTLFQNEISTAVPISELRDRQPDRRVFARSLPRHRSFSYSE